MLALSVKVNGKHCCTIGFDEPIDWEERGGVLSAHVVANHGLLDLHAGGLSSRTNEHLRWAVPRISVGDSVTIDIIDSETVDPPIERFPAKPRPDKN
jgi:hypothetical protein